MAEIIRKNTNIHKQRIALEDCEVGDIVLLNNKEIYIVTDGDSSSSTYILVNLSTGEQEEFDYYITCSCYRKPLNFDMSEFQEYI